MSSNAIAVYNPLVGFEKCRDAMLGVPAFDAIPVVV